MSISSLEDLKKLAERLSGESAGSSNETVTGLNAFIKHAENLSEDTTMLGKIQRYFVDVAPEQIRGAKSFEEIRDALSEKYDVTIEDIQ
jgi:hypothetical protein